ncbi:MAG: sigma-70 family RNA polymerase sigma factor [Candidatus Omnitrophica bacterium]|nr:sigma-70 family RNA polymerase sigma factor [Candidatus Omnitrophota bacterium]
MQRTRETELIDFAKHGDHAAFAELVQNLQPQLYRTIYRFVGNAEEARDILQESLLKAYQAINTFRGQSGFYTWLYRIAIRTCYREMNSRRFRVQQTAESISSQTADELVERAKREFISRQKSPREQTEQKEKIEQVRRAIKSLPPKYYEVIVLRDLEEFSYEEISKTLDISIGTVMSRLNRGRKRLLAKLKQSSLNRENTG